MPKIAIYNYLTFFIVMFDTLGEPPHLHVSKTKSGRVMAAKIWLESLTFSETGDLTQQELTLVQKLVETNRAQLLEAFQKARRGERIKPIRLRLK